MLAAARTRRAGSGDRSIRRWERSSEPFFVEEERERRLESLFEADAENTAADRDVAAAGGRPGRPRCIASCSSICSSICICIQAFVQAFAISWCLLGWGTWVARATATVSPNREAEGQVIGGLGGAAVSRLRERSRHVSVRSVATPNPQPPTPNPNPQPPTPNPQPQPNGHFATFCVRAQAARGRRAVTRRAARRPRGVARWRVWALRTR